MAMGREALVHAEVGDDSAEVRALLESSELIFRGDLRRRFPRDEMRNVRAKDGVLSFACGGERVRLHLGAPEAGKWADVLTKPPPSLRAKLGLDKGAMAFLVGTCDDAELAEALKGAETAKAKDADVLIARINCERDLDEALKTQASVKAAPLWVVYQKGKGVTFGDAAIRSQLRAAGFRDTKSCAVSERLTATRYNKS
jgi:hypothetical protein